MGAFLAGVLLSESSFRHQLEADVEPFRGILLGLFFLAVGMALDLSVVAANWVLILESVLALIVLKAAAIYALARLFGAGHAEALERMVLMAQGGEFAFVLYAAAMAVGLLTVEENAILTAVIILSMALTPLFVVLHDRLRRAEAAGDDGLEGPEGQQASVLLIGFGRFGQIVSQGLLARRFGVTIIDTDAEAIRAAETFGFKIYYGDGTRLDILRAAGVAEARLVVIATDKPAVTTRIAELIRAEYPDTPLAARAYDRAHAIDLTKLGVDHMIRETFESALALSMEALEMLDVPVDEAAATIESVRNRDRERFTLQVSGDIYAGSSLLIGNAQDQAEGR
jgi:CPA2 family monovalent cation:H+ antiporter-2/glutathione-regulated potassium-efflux system protein KefB